MTFRRLFSSIGKTIYPGSASPREIKTYLQLCLSFYYKVDLLTRRVTIPASLEIQGFVTMSLVIAYLSTSQEPAYKDV